MKMKERELSKELHEHKKVEKIKENVGAKQRSRQRQVKRWGWDQYEKRNTDSYSRIHIHT